MVPASCVSVPLIVTVSDAVPTVASASFCASVPVTVRPVPPFDCSVAAPICDTSPEILSVLIVPFAVCSTVAAVMPFAPVAVIVPPPSCVRVFAPTWISFAVTSPETSILGAAVTVKLPFTALIVPFTSMPKVELSVTLPSSAVIVPSTWTRPAAVPLTALP